MLDGRLRFVDLDTGAERVLTAPGRIAIAPGTPHRFELDGAVRGRLEFYRE